MSMFMGADLISIADNKTQDKRFEPAFKSPRNVVLLLIESG